MTDEEFTAHLLKRLREDWPTMNRLERERHLKGSPDDILATGLSTRDPYTGPPALWEVDKDAEDYDPRDYDVWEDEEEW